jgi:hypothetical protein
VRLAASMSAIVTIAGAADLKFLQLIGNLAWEFQIQKPHKNEKLPVSL